MLLFFSFIQLALAFIYDPADLLQNSRPAIESSLATIRATRKHKCVSTTVGYQVGLYVLDDVPLMTNLSIMAERILADQKIGTCNDGILLLVLKHPSQIVLAWQDNVSGANERPILTDYFLDGLQEKFTHGEEV